MTQPVRLLVLTAILALPSSALAQDLIMNGGTMSLGGVRRYNTVSLTNGARITVPPYNGTDRTNTGNLVLIANSITIDATSSIDATGAGYGAALCGNGNGPTATAGGRGGCALLDSGGGGAHFGAGGRGTKDCPACGGGGNCCVFPRDFEEDCGNSLSGGMCSNSNACATGDGQPSVAGVPFTHSLYTIEFGAAGGDKGCRDGDGFTYNAAGPGGGRVVLVSVSDARTGAITINGTVRADGRRGCGIENDSAGGGAGGTIFIVGDAVTIGATGVVSAGGGLGGDTRGSPECPAGGQSGGTCDDCGGGGGGGIVAIQSRTNNYNASATFNVSGAVGGVCTICQGEAGGSAGELQLTQAYAGEICDGFDNDFDGMTDEGLPQVACGLGACARQINACTSGGPTACSPMVTADPTCSAPRTPARPRVAVILDTSGSMLLDLNGVPTFGDGSVGHTGIDTNNDGQPNDSRLNLARNALGEVISAYPEIDFALARYHQDSGTNRSCQTARWIECQNLVASYDNPTNNTGAVACTLNWPANGAIPARSVTVRTGTTRTEECINYVGSCGAPRRGADILSGFGSATRDVVRWLDGRETAFDASETAGNYCNHAGGAGDCEVRGSGPTPLAGSLNAVEDYVVPIRATDPSSSCRTYSIILVTDGAESCEPPANTVAAAQRLFTMFGIQTYVIAVSVLPGERASLNQIARAGSNNLRDATFVTAPDQLVPALTSIIAGSIRFERCNGMDDDCDGMIDEDFPDLGSACSDTGRGVCRGTGNVRCKADGSGTQCNITMPGQMPGTEMCNGMDDNCNDRIDEGLSCTTACTPSGPEVCNGADDDCNGAIDEADPMLNTPCGPATGVCQQGMQRCVRGMLTCIGGVPARMEVCNGLDDDCDGNADNAAPCPAGSLCVSGACRRGCDPRDEFPCPFGFDCQMPASQSSSFCIPTACASCTADQRCANDACVDRCDGVTCMGGKVCRRGECVGCEVLGCPSGQLCLNSACAPNPCNTVSCGAQACVNGTCTPTCDDTTCPSGQACGAGGRCVNDPCAGVMCTTGQACVNGTCVSDTCRACPSGGVCQPGRGCVADPCAITTCPSGSACRVGVGGQAYCRTTPVFDAGTGGGNYVATGGGSCSARGTGSHGGALLALLALVLGVLARRRAR